MNSASRHLRDGLLPFQVEGKPRWEQVEWLTLVTRYLRLDAEAGAPCLEQRKDGR